MKKDSLMMMDETSIRSLAADSIGRLFDNLYDGAVAVDKDARIVWMNDKYKALIGWNGLETLQGIPVEEVIPNSRMRQVAKSGQAELLDIFSIGERDTIVSRIPLTNDKGKIVGALGIILYDRLQALKPLFSRFETLQKDLDQSKKELAQYRRARYSFREFIGNSTAVRDLKSKARRAASGSASVLLLGETGTGKEILAHAIHASSARSHKPMIRLNTAAIPEHLLEAELFGTAPGAYTGAASKTRQGKFQAADGGSIFLDEIGDMPISLQSKLLRVLQEKEVEPLGANKVIPVDVRIIAATSRDLEQMVKDGQFRADLYYRLNVVPIKIPPLRDRKDDLPAICEFLIDRIAEETHRTPPTLSPEALRLFAQHDWPGNVRELSSVLQRALLRTDAEILTDKDFQDQLNISAPQYLPTTENADQTNPKFEDENGELYSLRHLQHILEKSALANALIKAEGNKSRAAKLLGISRAQFYEKLAIHSNLSGK